jgi:hypothetical protein
VFGKTKTFVWSRSHTTTKRLRRVTKRNQAGVPDYGRHASNPERNDDMGKEIPRSFEKIRSGEQLNLKMRGFTNVASLTAAGITAAKNSGALVYLSTGGTGAVPCLAFSDGTNWKQVAIGANAI